MERDTDCSNPNIDLLEHDNSGLRPKTPQVPQKIEMNCLNTFRALTIMASYTFTNYLGEVQTVSRNDILSFHADTLPRYTGRVITILDGKAHIRWTHHFGNNAVDICSISDPKMVAYHHIAKTTQDNIVLHPDGFDTTNTATIEIYNDAGIYNDTKIYNIINY